MEKTNQPTERDDDKLDLDAIEAKVKGPAYGVGATAIIGIVFSLIGLGQSLLGTGEWTRGEPEEVVMLSRGLGILASIIAIIICFVIMLGAKKMMELRQWGFALTASILGMIPVISPCFILGLPFGIWAIVILSNAQVKAAFK